MLMFVVKKPSDVTWLPSLSRKEIACATALVPRRMPHVLKADSTGLYTIPKVTDSLASIRAAVTLAVVLKLMRRACSIKALEAVVRLLLNWMQNALLCREKPRHTAACLQAAAAQPLGHSNAVGCSACSCW